MSCAASHGPEPALQAEEQHVDQAGDHRRDRERQVDQRDQQVLAAEVELGDRPGRGHAEDRGQRHGDRGRQAASAGWLTARRARRGRRSRRPRPSRKASTNTASQRHEAGTAPGRPAPRPISSQRTQRRLGGQRTGRRAAAQAAAEAWKCWRSAAGMVRCLSRRVAPAPPLQQVDRPAAARTRPPASPRRWRWRRRSRTARAW